MPVEEVWVVSFDHDHGESGMSICDEHLVSNLPLLAYSTATIYFKVIKEEQTDKSSRT